MLQRGSLDGEFAVQLVLIIGSMAYASERVMQHAAQS